MKVGGNLVSRTFKPIRNNHIRYTLESILPDGMDGELLSGDTFQQCTSAVMRADGKPAFVYMIFDYIKNDSSLNKPYKQRVQDYELWYEEHAENNINIDYVISKYISNPDELRIYEESCLSQGYEGVMVRDPNGRYKCGRSGVKEGILLKVKRFVDNEAIVLDFEELMHNDNEKTRDAFGLAERSSAKANLVPAGMLGSLLVRDVKTGIEFGIGSGFDQQTRIDIWQNRNKYVGKLVKYKSFAQGVKDAPRFPTFLGFRHEDDL